tara:strand:+ start:59 stop:448 length:390 start_codon:yes stop_codon:yes gene_type:complete
MLGWIMQISIISIIIIILLHYLFIFFKTNLTSPQTKDLVSMPQEQYKEIFNSISDDNSTSNIDNLPTSNLNTNNVNQDKMKQELKDFLKDLSKQNKQPDLFGNNINSLNSQTITEPQDINSYSNSYSAY